MKITLENRKKVSQFGNILKHLKHFSQDIEIFINEERLYAQEWMVVKRLYLN